MNITKGELIKKLKMNNGLGLVELNDVLHEVRLVGDNQIVFSGACWKWEQTQMPSSHGDYAVITDVLMEEEPTMNQFPNQETYSYFEEVSDFS